MLNPHQQPKPSRPSI